MFNLLKTPKKNQGLGIHFLQNMLEHEISLSELGNFYKKIWALNLKKNNKKII